MSFDLDAALEALARRIDRIESDRVARMAELERKFAERIDTLVAGCNSHSRRLEALERNVSDETWGDGVDKRIRELEARCQEVAGAALAALQDRDRVARWHATYDALAPVFVGRCIGAATLGDTLEETKQRMEWAIVHGHKLTGWYCDRAHGPLADMSQGLFVPDDPALVTPPLTEKQWAALRPDPGWSQWDAKVEALVKAARRQLCGHTRADHDGGCGCPACELAGAAEPFETERSE